MTQGTFPRISEAMSENTERFLINRMTDGAKLIYTLLHESENWEQYYTFKETENGEVWIQEAKGIKFDTKEQARLYAFLKYCEWKNPFNS